MPGLYSYEKVYRVLVRGRPTDFALNKWERGVYLDGRRTAPARVTALKQEKTALGCASYCRRVASVRFASALALCNCVGCNPVNGATYQTRKSEPCAT